jgi:hypothetical protein
MIWRRILATVLATCVAAVGVPVTAARVSSPAAVASTVSTPYQVVLPKPTGPYTIGLYTTGMAEVWLTDARRELMVSVWYPTRATRRQFATYAKPWGRHPVLLYSPGSGASPEDLASHGYVVVTIEHTGEPGAVKKATDTRTADVRFVLESLPRLPRRLRRAMDLNRIEMVGETNLGHALMRLNEPRAVTVR